jgi:putative ABC transport system permease protein
MTFLVITLIIGAIVLFVINQINVRERKYEIGVLRTIGMRKSFLTIQFASELLIITIASLILGAGLGACLSAPVGNMLLANEITSSKESTNAVKDNFGGNMPGGPTNNNQNSSSNRGNFDMSKVNGLVSIQAYDSIDAVVDFTVVLELLLIGIGLTLISSISSMISIQRFSPLEILKERG